MRTIEERNKVMELHAQGKNNSEISKLTGIPRCTVRDIVSNKFTKKAGKDPEKFSPDNFSEEQKAAYSYILGQYFGNGCIDLGPRNVYRLRISYDVKYSNIIQEIKDRLKTILPTNSPLSNVKKYNGAPSCDDITIYSKQLQDMFPQHSPGKKQDRNFQLIDWQKNIVDSYAKDFIRGLLHSDGNRIFDPKDQTCSYKFTNTSLDILDAYKRSLDKLNISYRTFSKNLSSDTGKISYSVITDNVADVILLDAFVGSKS